MQIVPRKNIATRDEREYIRLLSFPLEQSTADSLQFLRKSLGRKGKGRRVSGNNVGKIHQRKISCHLFFPAMDARVVYAMSSSLSNYVITFHLVYRKDARAARSAILLHASLND